MPFAEVRPSPATVSEHANNNAHCWAWTNGPRIDNMPKSTANGRNAGSRVQQMRQNTPTGPTVPVPSVKGNDASVASSDVTLAQAAGVVRLAATGGAGAYDGTRSSTSPKSSELRLQTARSRLYQKERLGVRGWMGGAWRNEQQKYLHKYLLST